MRTKWRLQWTRPCIACGGAELLHGSFWRESEAGSEEEGRKESCRNDRQEDDGEEDDGPQDRPADGGPKALTF
jgi:hypothetical protein